MAKHVIKDKVYPWRHTTFMIQKAAVSEQDIRLHFGRRVSYEVLKLSTKGLPTRTRNGKKIRWISNFAVRDSKGKYVRDVRYTVFLRAPKKKATFVYHDHRGLHWDKTPKYKGSRPARPGMVQVDLNSGDPGVAWT